ncbi:uncharacterized protein [Amphiura filiformis]|uniref:uncharacterized protein n=1 Tax=Amphiura filiformis TaxID=82378 RepID=UPI003B21337E
MPRFTIPKIKDRSVQGNRHPVPNARERSELHDIVKHSCLDKNVISRYWVEKTTTSVHQPALTATFHQKRKEVKSTFGRDPRVGYAFGFVRKDSLANDVCSDLSFKNHEFCDMPLGDADKGVNLFLHADLLLEWARKQRYAKPCLIIYKIIKGRCKVLPRCRMTNGVVYEPTLNYDSHVLQEKAHTNDDLKERIMQSQIFLYEYDNECLPVRNPRHCLPYAVICFKRDESVPPRQSRQEPNSAPLQSVHSRSESRAAGSACLGSSSSGSNIENDRNESSVKVDIRGSVCNIAQRCKDSEQGISKKPSVLNHSSVHVDILRNDLFMSDDSENESDAGASDLALPQDVEKSDDENSPSDFISAGEVTDDEDEGEESPMLNDGSDVRFSSDDETGASPFSNGYHSSASDAQANSQMDIDHPIIGLPSNNSESESNNYNSDTSSVSDLTPSEDEDDIPSCSSIKVVSNNSSTKSMNMLNIQSNGIGAKNPNPQTGPKKLSPPENKPTTYTPKKLTPVLASGKRQPKKLTPPAQKRREVMKVAEARRGIQMNDTDTDDDDHQSSKQKKTLEMVKKLEIANKRKLEELKLRNASARIQNPQPSVDPSTTSHKEGKKGLIIKASARKLLKQRLQVVASNSKPNLLPKDTSKTTSKVSRKRPSDTTLEDTPRGKTRKETNHELKMGSESSKSKRKVNVEKEAVTTTPSHAAAVADAVEIRVRQPNKSVTTAAVAVAVAVAFDKDVNVSNNCKVTTPDEGEMSISSRTDGERSPIDIMNIPIEGQGVTSKPQSNAAANKGLPKSSNSNRSKKVPKSKESAKKSTPKVQRVAKSSKTGVVNEPSKSAWSDGKKGNVKNRSCKATEKTPKLSLSTSSNTFPSASSKVSPSTSLKLTPSTSSKLTHPPSISSKVSPSTSSKLPPSTSKVTPSTSSKVSSTSKVTHSTSKVNPSTSSKVTPLTSSKVTLSTSSKVTPSTLSKVSLSTSSKVSPSTSKVSPSTLTKVSPSTSSKVNPSTSSKVSPSISSKVSPTSSKVTPSTSSKVNPSTSSKVSPSTSSKVTPSISTKVSPSTSLKVSQAGNAVVLKGFQKSARTEEGRPSNEIERSSTGNAAALKGLRRSVRNIGGKEGIGKTSSSETTSSKSGRTAESKKKQMETNLSSIPRSSNSATSTELQNSTRSEERKKDPKSNETRKKQRDERVEGTSSTLKRSGEVSGNEPPSKSTKSEGEDIPGLMDISVPKMGSNAPHHKKKIIERYNHSQDAQPINVASSRERVLSESESNRQDTQQGTINENDEYSNWNHHIRRQRVHPYHEERSGDRNVPSRIDKHDMRRDFIYGNERHENHRNHDRRRRDQEFNSRPYETHEHDEGSSHRSYGYTKSLVTIDYNHGAKTVGDEREVGIAQEIPTETQSPWHVQPPLSAPPSSTNHRPETEHVASQEQIASLNRQPIPKELYGPIPVPVSTTLTRHWSILQPVLEQNLPSVPEPSTEYASTVETQTPVPFPQEPQPPLPVPLLQEQYPPLPSQQPPTRPRLPSESATSIYPRPPLPDDPPPPKPRLPSIDLDPPPPKPRLPSTNQDENFNIIDMDIDLDSSGGLVVDYGHKRTGASKVTLESNAAPKKPTLKDASASESIQMDSISGQRAPSSVPQNTNILKTIEQVEARLRELNEKVISQQETLRRDRCHPKSRSWYNHPYERRDDSLRAPYRRSPERDVRRPFDSLPLRPDDRYPRDPSGDHHSYDRHRNIPFDDLPRRFDNRYHENPPSERHRDDYRHGRFDDFPPVIAILLHPGSMIATHQMNVAVITFAIVHLITIRPGLMITAGEE